MFPLISPDCVWSSWPTFASTVMVAPTELTSSTALALTSSDARTSISLITVGEKPLASTVTLYLPGRSDDTRKVPTESVVVLCVSPPRSMLTTLTVALATAPPVLSVTVPTTLPLLDCAKALPVESNRTANSDTNRRIDALRSFMRISPFKFRRLHLVLAPEDRPKTEIRCAAPFKNKTELNTCADCTKSSNR